MTCYLPDHLVRCLICKNFFSDARRLHCGCVYCYSCCLTLVHDNRLDCLCSFTYRFQSSDDLAKALVIDSVVNDLVRQRLKNDRISESFVSIRTTTHPLINERKHVALAQPRCNLCLKKSHQIVLCEHCQTDICELCMDKHYDILTNTLEKKWIECEKKFHQINAHVSLSHHDKTMAMSKLNQMRKLIEERTKNLQTLIENHQQSLARHIDKQIEQLEQIIETNRQADNEYRTMRELLPRMIKEETKTSNLISFLDKIEELLQRLKIHDEKMKQIESKIPYLFVPDISSIKLNEIFGEFKFDEPTIEKKSNNQSMSFHRGRFPRRTLRSCGRSMNNDIDVYPNHRNQWFIDFKEIPYFLCVFDNRQRAKCSTTPISHRHDYLLYISDDRGQLVIYNFPHSKSMKKPTLIQTGELFSKNSSLLLETFTVCQFAIIVYVRRFEQRSNEIEHRKLLKAGLPIMSGEQGRCNDHGGMIYLFSHSCEEIDGVYQSHPIRTILADSIYLRLWALNPMENYLYSYSPPTKRNEIHKRFQDEEILLDFSHEQFEPTLMFQSKETIGLIDVERDLYRLYAKNDPTRLITSYQNVYQPQWKITDGLVFQDNRTLIRMNEEKLSSQSDEIDPKRKFGQTPRRRLIELNSNGEEKRQFQANSVYSMTLGPNDELILGFAVRGDRGLIHCY